MEIFFVVCILSHSIFLVLNFGSFYFCGQLKFELRGASVSKKCLCAPLLGLLITLFCKTKSFFINNPKIFARSFKAFLKFLLVLFILYIGIDEERSLLGIIIRFLPQCTIAMFLFLLKCKFATFFDKIIVYILAHSQS